MDLSMRRARPAHGKGRITLTAEQILKDLYTDRVKKAIIDSDYSAEIDDQYTLAYCLGSDKIDLLAAGAAAHYEEPMATDTEKVMLFSYSELVRVLNACEIPEDSFPHFEGARSQISHNEGLVPTDSPAARNIIETVKNSDEIVYVLVTGPCTNVVSACLMEPSIMDKICVVWLGGHCLARNIPHFHEWNLFADYAAAQYLMNLPVAVVMLPCDPNGSVMLHMNHTDLAKIEGDTKGADFFRRVLPLQETTEEKYTTWRKIMCDLAAPAVLTMPDAMELSIIPAPVITDEQSYAFDPTRKKILYMQNPDSDRIVTDAMLCINRLVNREK